MRPLQEQTHDPRSGSNDAYFSGAVARQFMLGARLLACVIPVCGILLWSWGCWPKKPAITTLTMMKDIGHGYENYLLDGQDDSEFASPQELIDRIVHNPRGILYFDLAREFRGQDGSVIDTWGRPLQIRRIEDRKIEIRSAGRDGKFATADDPVSVHPREKVE